MYIDGKVLRMKYKRVFKLKKYWKRWLKAVSKRHYPRMGYEWDNEFWYMGTNVAMIAPYQVNLFIKEYLAKVYNRPGLGLKIQLRTTYPRGMEINRCIWGDEESGKVNNKRQNLVETSRIQNLYAFEQLAPRVVDLVFLDDGKKMYVAQVVEFVKGEEIDEVNEKRGGVTRNNVIAVAEELGFNYHDVQGSNMKRGYMIDFQSFEFNSEFRDKFIDRIKMGLAYGGDLDKPYQSIEEIGIEGSRNNSKRAEVLKPDWDELPKNFTAMDVGCNGAYFLRRAFDGGAGYGIGIDVPRVCSANGELFPYLGYFNADFQTEIPRGKFDCVFWLSAFGYYTPQQIFSKVKQVCYIEGHNLNHEHTEENYRKKMEPYFSKIETLGWVQDEPGLAKRIVMKGTV
jgi:hypothetical protein